MRYRWHMSEVTSSRSGTRSKIVEVAARLLQEQGPAAVTTRGVAEAAGVQAPAIYRLFGDKDGLLDAVAEHVMATYVSAKAAIVEAASAADVDPVEDLRAGWQMQIDFGLANPMLTALLSDPARGRRSPAAQSGRHVLESRVHRVALTGRLRVSERRAVDLIHAAGTGAVLALLSRPPEQRDPGLAGDMFDAVLRHIVTDAPELPDSGPVASAVALRAVAPRLDMLSDAERHLLTEWLDRAIGALQS
jgi:AcrR family transcriptional regulator